MTQAFQKLKTLALRLTGILLIYSLLRVLFILTYYGNLKEENLSGILSLLLYGLRYDLAAIFILNSLFILFSLLPLNLSATRGYQLFLKIIFIFTNSLAFAAAVADIGYFKYSNRRMTAAIFGFLSRKEDSWDLLPVFLKDFWYLFLLFILLVWYLSFLFRRTQPRTGITVLKGKEYLSVTAALLVALGISIIAMRGGIQKMPLKMIIAGNYAKPHAIPFVLNTPYSLIETATRPEILEVNYMPPQEAASYYTSLKKGSSPDIPVSFPKRNIVLIILESFSKEYTGLAAKNSSTPFLDSLMQYSLVMTNAYANGKQSIEGIPSILASMPSWFNYDYMSSSYGTNKINSIGSILTHQGYQSAFYHGGKNGTMHFDDFIKIAEGGSYYGLDEYPDKADFDGNWGIWDEPYLQYFAKEMGKMHQPFFTSVFTLSSHNPFDIPEKYKTIFPAKEIPALKSVRYTDHALKLFFDAIKERPWFHNTIFVFTADHTGIPVSAFNETPVGNYQIPIIFYSPDNSLQKMDSTPFQQVDIMPTVLDMVHNQEPYFSFGNSLYDQSVKKFVLYNIDHTSHFISGDTLVQFNGNTVTGLYNLRTDSFLRKNLLPYVPAGPTTQLKAILQTYNAALINNKTTFSAIK